MADLLTNEQLKKECESNFELVWMAISLARYYMESGREASLKNVLSDMRRHPNAKYLEELKQIDAIEKESRERQGENGV